MNKSDSEVILEMYKLVQAMYSELKSKPWQADLQPEFDRLHIVLDKQSTMLDLTFY